MAFEVVRKRLPVLGALELRVLDQLWSQGPSDVRAMHARVGAERGISTNTVQSAMERLFRKGLAVRRKAGRAYVYEATCTRREWAALALRDLVDGVPGLDRSVLATAFVDLAHREEPESLAELERLVRARRRRQRGGAPR